MSWVDRLKDRWKVESVVQVMIILLVFACTGFTVLFIKKPVLQFFFPTGEKPLWATISYWILIFPAYNVILLFYGFIFGQFKFFWNFEKRFITRIFSSRKK